MAKQCDSLKLLYGFQIKLTQAFFVARVTVYKFIAVNKAKWRISKRVLQKNEVRQVFLKANISYLLIRTRACAVCV